MMAPPLDRTESGTKRKAQVRFEKLVRARVASWDRCCEKRSPSTVRSSDEDAGNYEGGAHDFGGPVCIPGGC